MRGGLAGERRRWSRRCRAGSPAGSGRGATPARAPPRGRASGRAGWRPGRCPPSASAGRMTCVVQGQRRAEGRGARAQHAGVARLHELGGDVDRHVRARLVVRADHADRAADARAPRALRARRGSRRARARRPSAASASIWRAHRLEPRRRRAGGGRPARARATPSAAATSPRVGAEHRAAAPRAGAGPSTPSATADGRRVGRREAWLMGVAAGRRLPPGRRSRRRSCGARDPVGPTGRALREPARTLLLGLGARRRPP